MIPSLARHRLIFKVPSRTSREVLTYKNVWYIRLTDHGNCGIGECASFPGLGCDWTPDYEVRLADICKLIKQGIMPDLSEYPSMRFGVESALAQLGNNATPWHLGDKTIIINGLVWMGNEDEMTKRVEEKLEQGFRCIKLKIGGLDFDRELSIIRAIRSCHGVNEIEIRLDANGAFSPREAIAKLERLAKYDIHSIEQPIRQGQWKAMADICRISPISIALDEELIGLNTRVEKERMLDTVCPQYIILKPSLCGGLSGSDEWIELARNRNIGWWATSALESNVGLDAIANWVSKYTPSTPQGLGTGALYTNNIPSPLVLDGETLRYDPHGHWKYDLNWIEP